MENLQRVLSFRFGRRQMLVVLALLALGVGLLSFTRPASAGSCGIAVWEPVKVWPDIQAHALGVCNAPNDHSHHLHGALKIDIMWWPDKVVATADDWDAFYPEVFPTGCVEDNLYHDFYTEANIDGGSPVQSARASLFC